VPSPQGEDDEECLGFYNSARALCPEEWVQPLSPQPPTPTPNDNTQTNPLFPPRSLMRGQKPKRRASLLLPMPRKMKVTTITKGKDGKIKTPVYVIINDQLAKGFPRCGAGKRFEQASLEWPEWQLREVHQLPRTARPTAQQALPHPKLSGQQRGLGGLEERFALT